MAKRRNDEENEKLTDANIEEVVWRLASKETKFTKKDACAFLGITYNTTRLNKIIEDYEAKKERDKAMRSEKRGKPATPAEIGFVISGYLEGSSVEHLADSLYRGTTFVNSILDQYGVPRRSRSYDYRKPGIIPEIAQRERFKIGEVVWSTRYETLAVIRAEQHDPRYGWIYRIWLKSDKWNQFAYQEAYELASLDAIRAAGVAI